MATLLLPLAGPMQAWGTRSRFDQRDTELMPSKSGVLGLLAAALGIERSDWASLEPLTHLKMGVREDKVGLLSVDYHTAEEREHPGTLAKAHKTAISKRYFLADAVFLVGLEGNRQDLTAIYEALKNPRWPLFLGRKAFVPGYPVYFAKIENALHDAPLEEVLKGFPWIGGAFLLDSVQDEKAPEGTLRLFLEQSEESSPAPIVLHIQDQPVAAFSERQYRYRQINVYTVEIGGKS